MYKWNVGASFSTDWQSSIWKEELQYFLSSNGFYNRSVLLVGTHPQKTRMRRSTQNNRKSSAWTHTKKCRRFRKISVFSIRNPFLRMSLYPFIVLVVRSVPWTRSVVGVVTRVTTTSRGTSSRTGVWIVSARSEA